MAGFLYKDFISIKGKSIVWLLLGLTVVFLVLRFIFPGDMETEAVGMGSNGAGELLTIGELSDMFLLLIPIAFIACSLCLPTTWTNRICKNDEKNKIRQFVRVLPCEKNAYIASKYIFIGIAIYVLFSLENIWIVIFDSRALQDSSVGLLNALAAALPAFSGACLGLAAFEFPFLITLGGKKGNLVKTAILEVIGLLVVAYMFFGNIKMFQDWDIYAILNWCEKHTVLITVISAAEPVIAIFLYYLSYKLTCRLNRNREVEIDG